MWELDHKEDWVLKNWCFWIVGLEKTFESPSDLKEIKQVHPKGNLLCVFIGRTDAEAEAPVLWPPDAKSWFIGKDTDAGKDWGQEEKGTPRMRWLDGATDLDESEFERTLGNCEGQGSLACCSCQSWRQLSDWTTTSLQGGSVTLLCDSPLLFCVFSAKAWVLSWPRHLIPNSLSTSLYSLVIIINIPLWNLRQGWLKTSFW